MSKATRYPAELRERAIRLVCEHRDEHASEWAAIQSIAGKLGMTPETLRQELRRDEVDQRREPIHKSSTKWKLGPEIWRDYATFWTQGPKRADEGIRTPDPSLTKRLLYP